MSQTLLMVSQEDLMQMVAGVAAEAVERTISRMAKEKKADKTISKKDVIKVYGVCDTTLWRLQRSGDLTPIKVKREVHYNLAEVERVFLKGVRV